MADPGLRIISSIGNFDVDGDRATISGRWAEWCELVDNQILAQGINNEARKKAVMLHIGEPQLWQLVKNLVIISRPAVQADPNANPPIVAVPQESDYEALKRTLHDYFNPQQNIELNKLQFREATQTRNETLDQFCGRLRQLSLSCAFTDVDAEIKSQLLRGMNNRKLQLTGYEEPALTLAQIFQKGRAQEVAQLQLKALGQSADESKTGGVNRTRQEKWYQRQGKPQQPSPNYSHQHSRNGQQHQQQSSGKNSSRGSGRPSSNRIKKDCPFCGGRFHEDGLSTCPARGKQCRHCNNYGHFEKMCQIKAHTQSRKENSDRRDKKVSFSTGRGGARAMNDDDGDDSSDVDGLDVEWWRKQAGCSSHSFGKEDRFLTRHRCD